jgi:hypothetical protein
VPAGVDRVDEAAYAALSMAGGIASASVVLGARLSITRVSQVGSIITVAGTGFAPVSMVNLFTLNGAYGGATVPVTVLSSTQLSFTVPSGAAGGLAYVQVLNPPFIPYTSTGSDPDGSLR